MRKIRNGVFETNSSSTHSITLSEGQIASTPKNQLPLTNLDECVIYTGETNLDACVIYTGEFGWEIEAYNDAPTKAAYALTYALQGGNLSIETNKNLQMLKRVIESGVPVGTKVLFDINTRGGWGVNGNIDHQSANVADEIFESDEKLFRFIFDRNSTLYTDNDNH